MTPQRFVTFSIPGSLANDALWTLKVVWGDGHVSLYQHDPRKHSQLLGANSQSPSIVVYFELLHDSWTDKMSPRSFRIVSMTLSSSPMVSESKSETLPKIPC